MTSAPPAVPHPAADALDPHAAARRRVAVTVGASLLVLAVVVALLVRLGALGGAPEPLSCAAADEGRPPAAVLDAARDARRAVGSRAPGMTVSCRLHAGHAPGDVPGGATDDASLWVVEVAAAADDVAGVVPLADVLLGAVRSDAGPHWRVEVGDAARTVVVVLRPHDGTWPATDAVALREVPGVVGVWVSGDDVRLTVATGQDVQPVIDATLDRGMPATTVEVREPGLEIGQVDAGSWPDAAAVALATDVARWPGVWHVVLRGGAPATADLTVNVLDDAARAEVAERLAGVAYTGETLRYRVGAGQVDVDGVLDAAPDPAVEADVSAVADAPWCSGAELQVEVLGTDAAAGSRFLLLRATSTSARACVVEGVPDLAFTRQSGTRTPGVMLLPDLESADATRPVLLEPGGVVDAQARWGAMSTSQDPDVAVRVTVSPVVGGPAVDLELPRSLDVLEGATVKVGPWRTPWLTVEPE